MRLFAWLCILLAVVIVVGGSVAVAKYNQQTYETYLKQLAAIYDLATIRAHLKAMAVGARPRAPAEISEAIPLFIGAVLAGFGILILAIRRPSKKRPDDDRVPCPFCAEDIKPEAALCPHCRSDLTKPTTADRFLRPRD